MSSWLAATPRRSPTLSNSSSTTLEVLARELERPGVAMQTPDAVVRGAALALQTQPKRERQHLAERQQRFVGAAELHEHVAVIVQGVETAPRVVLTEQLETAPVVIVGALLRVLRAREAARIDVREGRARETAGQLEVAREHCGVFLLASHVVLLREPIGDRLVTATARRRRYHLRDALALQVVLEDVLDLAGERRVWQAQHVVALHEIGERALDLAHVALGFGVPQVGRAAIHARERHQATQPKYAAHRRGVLEQALRSTAESTASRAATASSTVSGSRAWFRRSRSTFHSGVRRRIARVRAARRSRGKSAPCVRAKARDFRPPCRAPPRAGRSGGPPSHGVSKRLHDRSRIAGRNRPELDQIVA